MSAALVESNVEVRLDAETGGTGAKMLQSWTADGSSPNSQAAKQEQVLQKRK